jgi:hypothetical protein
MVKFTQELNEVTLDMLRRGARRDAKDALAV